MAIDLSNKRILVIGGTGFIGSRLVEKLVLETKAQIKILVRNYAKLSRLARFSCVDRISGDVLDFSSLMKAMQDCDIVFDLAFGNVGSPSTQRKVTIEGTKNVMEAAIQSKVERVVYVSTISVYGETPDGYLNETSPRSQGETAYARDKSKAEHIILNYIERGLPVTIIQPTVVYGPFSTVWTISPLNQLQTNHPIIIEGGLCNAVYVDDVIQAILLASEHPHAVGETFLISGEGPVTWFQFCKAYEEMLGVSTSLSLTREEASACEHWQFWRNIGTVPSVISETLSVEHLIRQPLTMDMYVLARQILPGFVIDRVQSSLLGGGLGKFTMKSSTKPLKLFNNQTVHFLAAKTHVNIDKAKHLLGYRPQFDLKKGMEYTEQWAKWANLVK